MKPILCSFLLLTLGLTIHVSSWSQQKVGLVLSGGGATGFAHIGVIQALEEKGVPIHYITGTSAGALIGALYAVGYSPLEIREIVLSENFQLMATGGLKPNQTFLTKEDDNSSSLLEFSFPKDSLFQKSLPTNFANSTFLDFELLKILGTRGAAHDNDFDQLFVPFRCLASDIVSKQNVVFRSGPLNEAVRASLTFPFYFKPLRVNDRLLFDGGLYNNFPADVLYEEFSPDYIIGSNVSYNAEEPKENDLYSQVVNMIVYNSNFNLPCEEGILIEPELDMTTFDFDEVERAIEIGYQTGLKYADSILPFMKQTVDVASLQAKREEFRMQSLDILIRNLDINAPQKAEQFVRKSLFRNSKDTLLTLRKLEKRYYRLAATDHVDFLFPVIKKNNKGTYDMTIDVRKSNEFKLQVGGHFSSRPVNTGYLGLTYLILRRQAIKLHASSYFGKFYGSAHADVKFELPSTFPLTIEAYFTRNRWDYFRSFATFFEEVKPSFLVQNENYAGLRIHHPISNTIKSTYDFRYFNNEDDYYQSDKFTLVDTTDKTYFEGFNLSWQIKQSSLNRKQFATSGHYLSFRARYVNGLERSISGSLASEPYNIRKRHDWINLNFDGQTFIIDNPYFHFGVSGKATFNSQSLFANYTATLLSLTTFDLVPDARTYFLPEYRSPLFFGGGMNCIFSLRKSIDLRFDGFLFQPLRSLVVNDDGSVGYSKPFKGETFMASASIIYHSIIGPVRFTANYFPKQEKPIAFQISYGYVLFNERSFR
ncbi:MAG: patatin-like phospholipase family protein [Crocinitomicaceae bacterium]|nr:patatin-like phospholipase family protein [Crocinitomicaceae bacterium]